MGQSNPHESFLAVWRISLVERGAAKVYGAARQSRSGYPKGCHAHMIEGMAGRFRWKREGVARRNSIHLLSLWQKPARGPGWRPSPA
jgi:hypothetical protein